MELLQYLLQRDWLPLAATLLGIGYSALVFSALALAWRLHR